LNAGNPEDLYPRMWKAAQSGDKVPFFPFGVWMLPRYEVIIYKPNRLELKTKLIEITIGIKPTPSGINRIGIVHRNVSTIAIYRS